MKSYFYFILIIFLFRIIYTFFEIILIYNKIMNIVESETVLFWTSMMEFMYTCSMGLLLLYVFGPALVAGKLCIYDKATLYIMEAFGLVLIINANWNLFFSKDELIKLVQSYLQINSKT